MAANILTWEIFLILTLKGKGYLKQLRDHCANANEVNRELLMRIIRDNQDTEYGRKYHSQSVFSRTIMQKGF